MSLDFDTQIEILLFDQEKIVTYKDIGNRFDIAPKEAQDVLKKFIANHKNSSKGEIHVVYLLTMENRETKNKKIQLANENEVDKFEEDYKVISKQIYSIQLKPITDFNLIYSSDIDASNNVKRKMNITVIFDENEQENQLWDNAMISMTTTTAPVTTSQRLEENKTGNKTTTKSTSSNEQNNILRPSKESNIDKKSTETTITTTTKTQEAAKVKDEPMVIEKEMKNDSSLIKKVKLESSEPSVTTTNIAAAKNQATTNSSSVTAATKSSSTTSKKQPPAKSAQQPTLTSFFKKA